ncbi:hypothetical protein C8R43DRAFT_981768, partial [Mycena crocata]
MPQQHFSLLILLPVTVLWGSSRCAGHTLAQLAAPYSPGGPKTVCSSPRTCSDGWPTVRSCGALRCKCDCAGFKLRLGWEGCKYFPDTRDLPGSALRGPSLCSTSSPSYDEPAWPLEGTDLATP